MDTCNQLILLLGIRYSSKNPDLLFPYGYGNMRYVTSLISGCGIMAFGCGLSMYHGISGLLHPEPLEPLTYVSFLLRCSIIHWFQAYYALFMSLCFQGTSAITAYREVFAKAKKANISIWNYGIYLSQLVHSQKFFLQSELPQILLWTLSCSRTLLLSLESVSPCVPFLCPLSSTHQSLIAVDLLWLELS